MSDTEAMFTVMKDTEVVAFIQKYHHDSSYPYEVRCACRVLGIYLLKKHKIYEVWLKVKGKD